MHVSDFAYDLPSELIAQNPVVPRHSARLFVYHRGTRSVEHRTVRDLPNLLPNHTHCVVNNSKVRHCRLHADRADGKEVEILVLEHEEGSTYTCLLRGRRIRVGEKLLVKLPHEHLAVQVISQHEHPSMQTYGLCFAAPADSLEALFEAYGEIPLPPYITQSSAHPEQYQTVFASDLGSAAAPTAGLHFTPELIAALKTKGHSWDEVTLHVGMGTFLPLRNNELETNQLHTEATNMSEEVAQDLNRAKQNHEPILAVGTTSTRTLEAHSNPGVIAGTMQTNLFIYPGYTFKTVNVLMTNFHLPHSSLLALVAAFIGNNPEGSLTMNNEEMIAELQRLYAIAIKERYRFFSFGDGMLII